MQNTFFMRIDAGITELCALGLRVEVVAGVLLVTWCGKTLVFVTFHLMHYVLIFLKCVTPFLKQKKTSKCVPYNYYYVVILLPFLLSLFCSKRFMVTCFCWYSGIPFFPFFLCAIDYSYLNRTYVKCTPQLKCTWICKGHTTHIINQWRCLGLTPLFIYRILSQQFNSQLTNRGSSYQNYT